MNLPEQPIAVGRTAEIYAWGEDCVIKLIRPGFPAFLADQEYTFAQAAWQLGARAPRPVETLDIDGRHGVVLQRVEGPTMIEALEKNIFHLDRYARQLARLQAEVHALSMPTFPSQSGRIRWNVYHSEFLSDEQKGALLRLIDSLPEGDRLCHGDFHPLNVILAKEGPIIIDWESSMSGNPAADVANTCVWIHSAFMFDAGRGGGLKRWIGERFERAYLAEYERAAPGQLEHLDDWIALKAASSLRADNQHQLPYLLPMIERGIGHVNGGEETADL